MGDPEWSLASLLKASGFLVQYSDLFFQMAQNPLYSRFSRLFFFYNHPFSLSL